MILKNTIEGIGRIVIFLCKYINKLLKSITKKTTNEFRMGSITILLLLTIGLIIFNTRDFAFYKQGYRIKVLFNSAGGISKNAPIKLAGVEVGKVEDIRLSYDNSTKVVMTLWLKSDTRVHADAKIYNRSLGLMGEKYIEINPGSIDSPLITPESTIIGIDPFRADWVTEKGEDIANNLDEAIKDIGSLASNVNDMIVTNKEEVAGIMANLKIASENLKTLTEEIKKNPWKVTTRPPGWKKMLEQE